MELFVLDVVAETNHQTEAGTLLALSQVHENKLQRYTELFRRYLETKKPKRLTGSVSSSISYTAKGDSSSFPKKLDSAILEDASSNRTHSGSEAIPSQSTNEGAPLATNTGSLSSRNAAYDDGKESRRDGRPSSASQSLTSQDQLHSSPSKLDDDDSSSRDTSGADIQRPSSSTDQSNKREKYPSSSLKDSRSSSHGGHPNENMEDTELPQNLLYHVQKAADDESTNSSSTMINERNTIPRIFVEEEPGRKSEEKPPKTSPVTAPNKIHEKISSSSPSVPDPQASDPKARQERQSRPRVKHRQRSTSTSSEWSRSSSGDSWDSPAHSSAGSTRVRAKGKSSTMRVAEIAIGVAGLAAIYSHHKRRVKEDDASRSQKIHRSHTERKSHSRRNYNVQPSEPNRNPPTSQEKPNGISSNKDRHAQSDPESSTHHLTKGRIRHPRSSAITSDDDFDASSPQPVFLDCICQTCLGTKMTCDCFLRQLFSRSNYRPLFPRRGENFKPRSDFSGPDGLPIWLIEYRKLSQQEISPSGAAPALPKDWVYKIDPSGRRYFICLSADPGERRCFWKPPIKEVRHPTDVPVGWKRIENGARALRWQHVETGVVSYSHPKDNPHICDFGTTSLYVMETASSNSRPVRWDMLANRENFKIDEEEVACQVAALAWNNV